MNGKPLVSVVVAFWNAEKFLQEAVDSVFAQTYEAWELLLVDDGSTDRSTELARQYAREHPVKVRYLEHDGHANRGACATRNLGLHHCGGEYVALLDSDDAWLPHKLEQQVAILVSRPEAAMVYGVSLYWYSWTGVPEDRYRDTAPTNAVPPDSLVLPPALLLLNHPLGNGNAPCPSDLLVRRQVFDRIGGFEEAFVGVYQLYEDQAFLAKIYLRCPVFVSGECWDKYRVHPDSCVSSVTRTGKQHLARRFFLNWLASYLSAEGVKDTEVCQALASAEWPYHHPCLWRLHPNYLAGKMKGVWRRIARRLPRR